MYQLTISNKIVNNKITKQCNGTACPAAPPIPCVGGEEGATVVAVALVVVLLAVGVSKDVTDAMPLLIIVIIVVAMVGLGELGVPFIVTDEVAIKRTTEGMPLMISSDCAYHFVVKP